MSVQLSLSQYHHIVIVARDGARAVRLWSEIFGFAAPPLNDVGPFFKAFQDPRYPSLLRGKRWDSDFKQAVFNQHSSFFEIDEPGTEDNFAEFVQKHGNGVAYIGLLAGNKRDSFLKRLENDYGCETVVEQYFPGGDWSVNYTEPVLGTNLCVKKLPGGDHTDHPVLPDFADMILVTDHLDQKLENWREIFGAKQIERISGPIDVMDHGRRRNVILNAAKIIDGKFPVILIEAGADSPFADYYQEHGSSFFQVTFSKEALVRSQSDIETAFSNEDIHSAFRFELFERNYNVFDSVDQMGVNIALA